ncbi:class I SAM-dependent methyltransferase [soil metagenome]
MTVEFVDLGICPPSNSYLSADELNKPEAEYPLRVFVCEKCFLVQIDEYKKATEIFGPDYAYFSSISKGWVEHAENYVEMMCTRFGYDQTSKVVEIASNDGYLLQFFKQKDISILGIEPTFSTAKAARDKGIETWTEFFGEQLAHRMVGERSQADLLLGNNVLAHVPDINDFVAGLKIALKRAGIVTMEFPHLFQLVENGQFDTIYHEHFSYLSLHTVSKIFIAHGLLIFDVEELTTHGGSLRIFAKHQDDETKSVSENVTNILAKERRVGLLDINYYLGFQAKADRIKKELLSFLTTQKKDNKKVAAYGAAAKGNTLFNYCGITPNLISFVVDASPHKQGKYMPGSRIPIVDESFIQRERPDFILILPWNLKDEISEQLNYINCWDGKFVTAVPVLQISKDEERYGK